MILKFAIKFDSKFYAYNYIKLLKAFHFGANYFVVYFDTYNFAR